MLYRLALSAAEMFPRLSRPLFGTDASMPGVVKGFAALRSNRRHAPVKGDARFDRVAAEIERVGHVALGRPYDSGLISAISAAFERLTTDDSAWKLRYESSGDIHSAQRDSAAAGDARGQLIHRDLVNPMARIPELATLLDRDTCALLEACYRTHFRLAKVTFWRNYHVPPAVSERAEVGYSHYWHNDGHAIDALKLFIVMTDVNEDDGPFHVISKAESRRLVRRSFDRKLTRHGNGAVGEVTPYRMTGPRGTTALCNTTLCLHRAGIPAPGRHRDMLQFQFASSAVPYRPAGG